MPKAAFLIIFAAALPSCFLFSTNREIPGELALSRNEIDSALDQLETETSKQPDNAKVWMLLGRAQLSLAQRGMEENASAFFVHSALTDAEKSLARARELSPADGNTLRELAKLKALLGNTEQAYELALEAQTQAQKNISPTEKFDLEKTVAEASFQKYLALRQENTDVEALALPFSRSFRALRECQSLDPNQPWSYATEADLFAWENASPAVIDALSRGIEKLPNEQSLHSKLVNYASEAQKTELLLSFYEKLLVKNPEQATALWFQGLTRFRHADFLRSQEQTQAALNTYQGAKDSFAKSVALESSFAPSADYYLALLPVSMGWCLYRERNLEEAIKLWVEVLRQDRSLKDKPDGLGMTAKQGLGIVGGEYISASEFEKGLELFKTLHEIDSADFDWANNYAFLCREAGSALETAGKKEAANARFEESYLAYEKVLSLAPEDARSLNDCALILLYHLDRELDRAESLFQKAANLGETSLASQDMDVQAEMDLRAAIGDAYQNLGVLYFDKKKEPLPAKFFFEKSLDVDASVRPQVKWYLQRITNLEKEMREWMLLWVPALGTVIPETTTNAAIESKSAVDADLAASLKKAQDLLRQGQVNDALDILDAVEKNAPDLPETNLLYGKTYLQKAENLVAEGSPGSNITWAYADAVKALSRAFEQMPKSAEAGLWLARAQFGSYELEQAAKTTDQTILLQPQSAEAHALKAEIAFARYREARQNEAKEEQTKFFEEAKSSFEKASKLNGKLAKVWNQWGDLLSWEGKRQEALDFYATALGLEPTEALASRLLKDYEIALWEKAFEKALVEAKKTRNSKDKGVGLLQWYLGYTYYQKNDFKKAKTAFEAAVDLNPDWVTANYYLGKLYYNQEKDYLAAAEAFARYATQDAPGLVQVVLEQDSDPERLKSILQFLEGESYGKGKGDWARELAKVNALLEPDKAERWNNYAFLSRETQKYEESYSAYTKALELDPENPSLLNDGALILQYHLHRDLDKAKSMYEKAIVNAEAFLKNQKGGKYDEQSVRTALRDATSNLEKLRKHPQGEKSE